MHWYRRVFQETDPSLQLKIICDACAAYEDAYDTAKECVKPPKGLITKMEMMIPGLAAENLARLRDLEIILQHIENMENVKKIQRTQYYMEHYQRKLTETVAKSYADVDDEVQAIRTIRFRVGSAISDYESIGRGLEYMHFQLSNLTKLRVAGLEDSEF